MTNITEQFNEPYTPFKALLLYRHDKEERYTASGDNENQTQLYIESYDIGASGKPVNAHPLSERETAQLSELMYTARQEKEVYLQSRGILPKNVLYVNHSQQGFALWHTPAQVIDLLFTESLGIPSGKFAIPALLWKAGLRKLEIFALKGKAQIGNTTKVYQAPFLNLYSSGQVCMGTVGVDIPKSTCLQDFMSKWQDYFFKSYFSHSINGNSNTKTNTTQLWRELAGKENQPFPESELLPAALTIKQLLS